MLFRLLKFWQKIIYRANLSFRVLCQLAIKSTIKFPITRYTLGPYGDLSREGAFLNNRIIKGVISRFGK
jgi:hypothetical protein